MDEEQLTQLIAEAMSLEPDERIDFFVNKGLTEGEIEDVLETIQQVEDFELAQDLNIANKEPEDAAERLSSDAEDELEQKAQKMADEDDTPVTVTEQDTDGDGDTDRETVEKDNTEDDTFTFGTGTDKDGNKHEGALTWPKDDSDVYVEKDLDTSSESEEPERDNSSESEDKPHDKDITSDVRLKNIDNSTNSIAKTLANYRW